MCLLCHEKEQPHTEQGPGYTAYTLHSLLQKLICPPLPQSVTTQSGLTVIILLTMTVIAITVCLGLAVCHTVWRALSCVSSFTA